jgi:hypothetical protein
MSIRNCIESAVKQNAMSREQADEVMAIYDRFLKQHRLAYGDAEAQRRAQVDTAELLDAEAAQRRRAALLQAKTAETLHTEMFRHTNARGEIDPAQFRWMILEHNGQTADGPRTGSVMGRYKALIGAAHSKFEEGLHEFRTSWFAGKRMNKARLDNVVREAFGQDTGDGAAKGIAKAWGDLAEDLRQRYNEMGGAIGKREKWGMPQRHDVSKMREVGEDRWVEETFGMLDREKMSNHLTGKPMTDDELVDSLRYVYKSVTTNGWAHNDATMVAKGRGSLVRQHAESRFLIFKDADTWLGYQRKFGEGDIFATMMGHINVMSRDIAAMTILGPNPNATLQWMKQLVDKEAAAAANGEAARFPRRSEFLGRKLNPEDYANRMNAWADNMWEHYTGSVNVPSSAVWADRMGTVRNAVTSVSLQGSIISALGTDPIMQKIARMYAGVAYDRGNSAFGLDLIGRLIRQRGTEPRRDAVRAGLIFDSAMNVMREEVSGVSAFGGQEWSRYLTDRTLTLNGLSPLTQTEKHAFGLDLMGTYSDHQQSRLGDVEKYAQRTLRRYGFDEADWALIGLSKQHDLSPTGEGSFILRPSEIAQITPEQVRAAMADQAKRDLIEAAGERMLTPDEMKIFKGEAPPKTPEPEGRATIPSDPPDVKVARYMRDLGERYHEMILQETQRAVPEPGLGVRSFMLGKSQPGTWVGERLRSEAMFKSFGASVWMLHVTQVFRDMSQYGKPGTALYAGAALGALTIGGAINMHLRSIRDGRDPESMASPDFWLRAMAAGGGWGIFGDFVLADTNRMGGSWAGTFAGPVVGRAENLWNLTAGNMRQLATDKNTNFGAELTKFGRQNVPLVNHPLTSMAWQRIFMDNLQQRIDPQAHRAFRRQEDLARQKGSGFYWGPGKSAPDRGPTFGRMFTPPPVR